MLSQGSGKFSVPDEVSFYTLFEHLDVIWRKYTRNGRDYNSTPKSMKKSLIAVGDGITNARDGVCKSKRRRLK
ncbi:hypothetical protein Tco_0110447 [Tanacetum coccineum]